MPGFREVSAFVKSVVKHEQIGQLLSVISFESRMFIGVAMGLWR